MVDFMFDGIIEEIRSKIEKYSSFGSIAYVEAYIDALEIIQNNSNKDEYIKIGKSYDSKEYVIVIENEADGSQSFTVRRRK